MNITTRKCDVCGARHDSDSTDHQLFGRFTDVNGLEYDVCRDCTTRLMHPLVVMQARGQYSQQPPR